MIRKSALYNKYLPFSEGLECIFLSGNINYFAATWLLSVSSNQVRELHAKMMIDSSYRVIRSLASYIGGPKFSSELMRLVI